MRRNLLKRGVAFLLCALMLLPMLASVSFANEETIPVFEPNVEVAAEEALLRGNAQITEDTNATGGKAVALYSASGEPGNQSSLTGSETVNVSLKFNLPEKDTYRLRMRYLAKNVGTDSVYLSFNGAAYAQPSISATNTYQWVDIGTYTLDAGTATVDVIRRESGFVIDSFILMKGTNFDAYATEYAPRVYTEGEIEYPKLLDAEAIGTMPKFEDGDRVVFIGDSITHGDYGGHYHKFLFDYYVTRYPNTSFSIINKGINGDKVNYANDRLEHDIFDEIDEELGGFNKVVIALGTNDMSRGEYYAGNELVADAEQRREALITNYTTNITKLVNSIVAKDNVEQIILQTPPLFDEFLGVSNKQASPGFSNVIRRAGSILYNLSKTNEKIDFVDVNTPQTIVEMYNLEKYGNTFTFVSDRVHPNKEGHYIMLYAFLKAQGESGEVATVDLDVTEQTNKVSNATLNNLSMSQSAVYYEYTPNSLPLAATSKYRTAEKLFPITDELNREIIRVKGLSEGVYDIKMDGEVLITVSAEQLEEGVNIADLKNNPGQQQSLMIDGITTERLKLDAAYRTFIQNEARDLISDYGLDATSNATLISSAQAWIDKNKSNPDKAAGVAELEAYIKNKNAEKDTVKTILKHEAEAYKRNKPSKHSVLIEASQNAAQTIAKSVYTDYELDQSVLTLVPKSHPKGVSANKVVFADQNGELSEMPYADTSITATVTVKNNTDEKQSAVVWAASYKEGAVQNIATKKVTLEIGESKTVEIPLNTKLGSDSLRAGVWNSIAQINPYTTAAVFPSNEGGIKDIYINGVKFDDFDENVMQYTYYVHKLQTEVPYVNVVAKNSNTAIEVKQAGAVGESATISVGGKVYTIKFVNEPLPILSSLKLDGVEIEGFDPYVYSYDCSMDSQATGNVTAEAGEGVEVSVVNEIETKKTVTVTTKAVFGATRTYTVKFMKLGTPGTISNVKHNGVSTTSVYGIPSLGAEVVNYAFDEAEKTVDEVYEQLLIDKPYANEAYSMYNNRPLENMWTKGNGTGGAYYGYHTQFMYADTDSMFIDKNVTRLFKPDTDRPEGSTADPTKMYEFDMSKGGTVYLATEATSPYIESLNKGWTHDYNAKYMLRSPKYIDKPIIINGKACTLRIPIAGTMQADNTDGNVYYKHFEAGEHVEIPSIRDGNVYRETAVFIVWDECNSEADIYDIFADGVSVGFDKDTLSYTVDVSGSDVPTISVSATAGANAQIVQAESIDDAATVTACGKTYTITFKASDNKPGTVSNFKKGGAASADVYAAPSLGIAPPNLTVDASGNALSADEQIAKMKALANDATYNTEAYAAFSNLKIVDNWTTAVNQYYGYRMKFIYAPAPDSILYGENVTRIVKPHTTTVNAATAPKLYEFDIDKPATVYISFNSKYASQGRENQTSEYIEGLGKGWRQDYNTTKYGLYTWAFAEATGTDGSKAYIPNGGVKNAWANSGSVYYKHFDAGDHVEIPAYSETTDNYSETIFIVWDNLSTEAKLFDIFVDGVSIGNFDENTLSYEYTLEEGSEIPEITVSATKLANPVITQAASLSDSAKIVVGDKTYTISFEVVAPNMKLANLMVDGTTIDGFDGEVNEYTYTVERGVMDIPQISATATLSSHTVEVTQAQKMPGKATVVLSSPSGAKNTYTINLVKTGTPGVASNFTYGGTAATESQIRAIPSLGAELINLYDMFETDAERVAYMKSDDNVYENAAYAQYSDRNSTAAWDVYSGYNSWDDSLSYTYGMQMEFILLNHKDSILISPDVTRVVKPADDPSGSEEKAKSAYTFDISKDATVYLTTNGTSDFIASQGWEYEYNKKYNLCYPTRSAAIRAIDTTQTKTDKDGNTINPGYFVPNGSAHLVGPGQGHVYKKHFTSDEKVVVPAFSATSSSRKMFIFIVWDDCNDERHLYGVDYKIGDGENVAIDFDITKTTYDITLPQGTTTVPTLDVSATRPVNVSVNSPSAFVNDKATVTMTAELEEGAMTTYTFNFYVDSPSEDDIRIKSVTFDGEAYDDFEMYKREYAVELAYGIEYPVLEAVANSSVANVVITQPADNNGVGLVSVTSQSGEYSALYTFAFTKLDYIPAQTEIMKVKDGKKGIVTIVHDDGDIYTTMPYLNREMFKNDLRTTVGMIAERIADKNKNLNTAAIEKWTPYFGNGRFNLASHSYTHTYMGQSDSVAEPAVDAVNTAWNAPIEATYVGKMSFELKGSQEVLRQAFPNQKVLSYIKPGVNYPIGKQQVSEEAYEMIKDTYISMRNTGGGVDSIPPSDWYNVKSLMVQSSEDPTSANNHTAAYWTELVDEAIEKGGWFTFLFHGIVPDNNVSGSSVSQSKTSILFDKLADRVERGDVWNAFFDEATMYIKEAQTANVVGKDYTTDRGYISVEVTDEMDNALYTYPITIKVAVPDTWAYVKNIQASTTEIRATFIENDVTYAYVNVVPDIGAAFVSQANSADYLSAITLDGDMLEGFDPTDYHYNVSLPAGTTEAPVVAADGATVTQAALTDGEGMATVVYTANGTEYEYIIYFEVEKDGPVVLLKLDDLREGSGVRTAFANAIDYCDEVGIKANVGVIAVSMEDADGVDKTAYYNEIKSYQDGGHEVWNHGYYHNTQVAIDNGYAGEFRDGTLQDQIDQLNRSSALFAEKVGFVPTSFGAPGNSTNADTAAAFNTYNEAGTYAPFTTAYFYNANGVEGMRGFQTKLDFESDDTDDDTFNPTLNYKKFVAAYEAAERHPEDKAMDYFILQTHPNLWGASATATHYKVFKDQIDYLIMSGAKFMTASEYDAMLDAEQANQ